MTIDIVRQGGTEDCWAACVSTLTGIPLDALPCDGESQLDAVMLPLPEGDVWVPATDSLVSYVLYTDTKWNTIEDWQKVLDRWHLEAYTGWNKRLGEGVLLMVRWLSDGTQDGHAVVLDEDGYIHDPAEGMDGYHYKDVYSACNVKVAGFITIREV